MKICPGRPYPLGATWDGRGINFALFSEHATGVELCLFDGVRAAVEVGRVPMRERTAFTWHAYVTELGPGTLYGYRVHGPWQPLACHRFNPANLLLDPYALALAGTLDWSAPIYGYRPDAGPDADLVLGDANDDDAWGKPLSVVVDPAFDWGNDALLDIPWHRTVIYEVHVKGFTARCPGVPEGRRGTYAGLGAPAAIEHLRSLGVTAVELLPIHAFVDEQALLNRGLTNYWGYNTIGYFAPDCRYASSRQPGAVIREFKEMVKTLHRAGIEVILDVVFNHTAEGNHRGPSLSFRGIDNGTYYRLRDGQPRFYTDYSGCGNSLSAGHPQVLKLIMDSLRYWVQEMHVDGFRFDLASALARELHDVDRLAAFLDIIHQDPVISRVKLIAEPWDLGEGGYQVGNFPILWREWNGRYRDTIRSFWMGHPCRLGELASRLAGSSDLYQDDGRHPSASINFVTCHDGFTLHDLVSYTEKHNEANGEDNRDGERNNLSANHGVEGPADDPAIVALRQRQVRNLLATLLFSQGVPMLSHGDEIGRTQRGNNNAWCHDSPLTWLDWHLDVARQQLLDFTRRVLQIRREQPVLRRRHFFQGRRTRGSHVKDLTWLEPDGSEVAGAEWTAPNTRALGLLMAGELINEADENGDRIVGDTLLLLLNGGPDPVDFPIPNVGVDPAHWELLLDTARPEADAAIGGEPYPLDGHSLALLRLLEGM